MPGARARRARPRRGRAGLGGDPAPARGRGLRRRARPSPAACTSRPVAWSASTAASRQALERALAAVGSTWDARAGAAERRFTALAAANVARPGQALVVSDETARDFLAPLSLTLLPLAEQEQQELHELGIHRLGRARAAAGAAVAERLGPEGRQAWQLARGGRRARVRGRRPPAEIVEAARLPGSGRERAHAAAGAGVARRPAARAARAARPVRPQARARRAARRRSLVAADADPARALGRPRPHPHRARAEARRAAGAGRAAAARAGRAQRGARPPARARCPVGGGGLAHGSRRACARCGHQHRRGRRVHRRRGRAVVADSRDSARCSFRGTSKRAPAGARRGARRRVAAAGQPPGRRVVREEWRVVDRWWTEEPLQRRYFDVVLESGQQAVVFRDQERRRWFTQRGA